jgi:hypothetical protein
LTASGKTSSIRVVSDEAHWTDKIVATCLVAAISTALAFLVGFVLPAFQHPFSLVTIPVLAALAYWSRPDIPAAIREHRNLAIAVGVAVLVLLPFLISPSWFGRLLP